MKLCFMSSVYNRALTVISTIPNRIAGVRSLVTAYLPRQLMNAGSIPP